MAKLTWHGHSCFELATDNGETIVFDPFLDDNPAADIKRAALRKVDYVLCSHGHWDHFANAIPLAQQTGAMMIGTFELISFVQSKGVKNTHALHIGGGAHFSFGYARMTPAMHGGAIDGDDGTHTTHAGGFWLDLKSGKRVYFAGDTALLMDMQLLQGRVDVALLPIGDNFTMGPDEAARAVDLIRPRVVIPMHYNTWDIIRQDPDDFARRVGALAEVRVLKVGGAYEF